MVVVVEIILDDGRMQRRHGHGKGEIALIQNLWRRGKSSSDGTNAGVGRHDDAADASLRMMMDPYIVARSDVKDYYYDVMNKKQIRHGLPTVDSE